LRDEFPAVAAAEPELVAHHLTQAGLDEPAIEWWGKAGDQAIRRSAFKEAAAHLGKAIELADKPAATAPSAVTGSDRLRLQTSLGNALIWAKGWMAPETSAAFARARELASRVEDASERFSAYYGLWVGHLTRCEPEPMREMAKLFLREATARPDCPEILIFPARPAFISEILPLPMSIFKGRSSSTTRRAMPISPTGSVWIPAPQRRFGSPSHCGCSVESTRLCHLPTVRSRTPSRQRMLRQ